MSVHVVLDGKTTEAERDTTLFACAETLGVRIPTSCFGQGKCRECLVEVEAGAELLGPRTPEEEALTSASGSPAARRSPRTRASSAAIRCAAARYASRRRRSSTRRSRSTRS